MAFRIATLNLEQDHKRWDCRRHLITEQLAALKPDIFTLNEICIPRQTGRWIQLDMTARTDRRVALVQQSKTNAGSRIDGEGLLTHLPIVETGNLDYQTLDYVALVTRLLIEDRLVDVYVTHLFSSLGEDSLRLFQVQRLLAWIGARGGADAQIICGDFNAPPETPAAELMAENFATSQTAPTAFTPLADENGAVSHPYWERFDRCIDYIWHSESLRAIESGVCFDRPHPDDNSLWPSDHAGVWADFDFVTKR